MAHMHISRFGTANGDVTELYQTLSKYAGAVAKVKGVEAARVFQGEGEHVVIMEFSKFATLDSVRDDKQVKKTRQGLAGLPVRTEWLSGSDPRYIYAS